MEEKTENEAIVHEFKGTSTTSKPMKQKALIFFLVAIVLGAGTGYVAANMKGGGSSSSTSTKTGSDNTSKGTVIGSSDEKTFKDSAEGVLKEGGIEDEGAYHLERPGGISQNVYLTSATLDLSEYVGKKVKVWGQTQTAQTAGWLMDVGRLQVLN